MMPVKNAFIAIFVLGLVACSTPTPLNVMSFNIRTEQANDPGVLAWAARKPLVVEVIKHAQPDVIGLQEASEQQKAYILKSLGNDWTTTPQAPILFRMSAFELIDEGRVELIEDKWEPRFAYWYRLRARNHPEAREWLFVSTHWGVDSESQIGSANILINSLPKLTENWSVPTVLLGDFNITPNSPPFRMVKENTPLISGYTGLTYTGFKPQPKEQLDYVWGSGLRLVNCWVDDFTRLKSAASDHYALSCSVRIE